jgi:hypothetical protein
MRVASWVDIALGVGGEDVEDAELPRCILAEDAPAAVERFADSGLCAVCRFGRGSWSFWCWGGGLLGHGGGLP